MTTMMNHPEDTEERTAKEQAASVTTQVLAEMAVAGQVARPWRSSDHILAELLRIACNPAVTLAQARKAVGLCVAGHQCWDHATLVCQQCHPLPQPLPGTSGPRRETDGPKRYTAYANGRTGQIRVVQGTLEERGVHTCDSGVPVDVSDLAEGIDTVSDAAPVIHDTLVAAMESHHNQLRRAIAYVRLYGDAPF